MTDLLDILTIASTRGPDDAPVCQLTWLGESWYAPVDDVRQAALDLVTCAAYGEMMMLAVTQLKLGGRLATAFTTDLLKHSSVKGFGSSTTVLMMPAGSTMTGEAVVLLTRGDHRGMVDTGEAMKMALRFLQAAEATESDQVVAEAMRGAGIDHGTSERLWSYLTQLRR